MGVFKDFASEDTELSLALKQFTKYRSDMNLPLTDDEKVSLCRKLEKYPREQWLSIIHQSIEKQWKGFYPLKQESTGKNFKVSNDPNKWANSPAFLQAIQDLLEWGNSDGRYHGAV